MPFSRPTLTQLINQVLGDISVGLSSTGSLLRFSNMRILGKALAKATAGLYGYLDWIAKQAVPFTASGEYLEGWAAFKGLTRKAATKSSGLITFSGSAGSVVPMGTALVRTDGATFTTLADATIVGGAAQVAAVAAAAGTDGNSAPGTQLTLSQAISGVNSTAVALTGIVGGAEVENTDDFRTRMLAKYASPPQGGAPSDYVEWASEVSGVTRAWVRRNGMGVGTVIVYFMMDDAEAAAGGFPQGTDGVASIEDRGPAATGDQLAVADAIYPLQPVTALVYAVAPAKNLIDITIAGLSGASAATKVAVTAAISAAITTNSSPGGTFLPNGTEGGVTQLSAIEAAIAAVAGSAGFVITAVAAEKGTVTPGPAGNVVSDNGYLAYPGATVFV